MTAFTSLLREAALPVELHLDHQLEAAHRLEECGRDPSEGVAGGHEEVGAVTARALVHMRRDALSRPGIRSRRRIAPMRTLHAPGSGPRSGRLGTRRLRRPHTGTPGIGPWTGGRSIPRRPISRP